MTEAQKTLMERDGLSAKEAKAIIEDAKLAINGAQNAGEIEEVLYDLGLEDDYIFDFLI